jgi:hypothetical protein
VLTLSIPTEETSAGKQATLQPLEHKEFRTSPDLQAHFNKKQVTKFLIPQTTINIIKQMKYPKVPQLEALSIQVLRANKSPIPRVSFLSQRLCTILKKFQQAGIHSTQVLKPMKKG